MKACFKKIRLTTSAKTFLNFKMGAQKLAAPASALRDAGKKKKKKKEGLALSSPQLSRAFI